MQKCNNLIPMTHEMSINKISSINPNIDIIGRFQGTRKKLIVNAKYAIMYGQQVHMFYINMVVLRVLV